MSLNFFSHALFKEFQDTSFLRVPSLCVLFSLFILILAQPGKQGPFEIGVDHLGMYITFVSKNCSLLTSPLFKACLYE